ncbi:MAG: hypothetical protein ABIR53_07890, partial [Paraperlucidibaca sp.]
HPLIYKAVETRWSLAELELVLQKIKVLAAARDTLGLKRLLQQRLAGYVPDLNAEDHSSSPLEADVRSDVGSSTVVALDAMNRR